MKIVCLNKRYILWINRV